MRFVPLVIAVLLAALPVVKKSAMAADSMKETIREQREMNMVVEQFARDRDLCGKGDETARFSVQRYSEAKDDDQLSGEVVKALAACRNKYLVKMGYTGSMAEYIYCCDGEKATLVAPASVVDGEEGDCRRRH